MDQYCAVTKLKLEVKLALDLNLPILKKSQYVVGNIDFPRVATVADWGKETDSEINVSCYCINPICTHVKILQFVIKMCMFTADLYKTHEKVVMTLFLQAATSLLFSI